MSEFTCARCRLREPGAHDCDDRACTCCFGESGCPASKSGRCPQPSDGLPECAEGECVWEVYDRAFPPAPADAVPPRRSTRKPTRGRLPELPASS